MKPVEFLSLADRLILSTNEAERRTAISRAYYYVYHHIKNSLVDPGQYLDHTVLVHCIREAKVAKQNMKEFEVLAEQVKDLKSDRMFADYKLHEELKQKTCDTMIKRCRAAIEDVEECKQAGLIAAARNYLRRFNYIR